MIKLKNLEKVYTTEEVETTALNSINLEIKDGEFVAIMDLQDAANQHC